MGSATNTIKEAYSEWRRSGVIERLHTLYMILAVCGFFFAISGDTVKEIVFLVIFGLYFLFMLILFVSMTAMYARKSRHPETHKLYHQFHHTIRDIYDDLSSCLSNSKSINREETKKKLCSALTSVATAFSMVTSVTCRASIKVIGVPEGLSDPRDYYLQTLARDGMSTESRRDVDKNEGYRHKIQDNTDFDLIFRGHIDCFFCNDLSESGNYLNSRLEELKAAGAQNGKNWPLPYIATIVCPIRFIPEGAEKSDMGKVRLYGFLTVDAPSRKVFNETTETQMAAAMADSLYPILDMYFKCKQQEQKQALQERTATAT